MKSTYFDTINLPNDLKQLSISQLQQYAQEVRHFLLESLSETGGHLASNLGVVELTIAIHRVFSSPEDKILWDVGHQCYVHKIITGRKKEFSTLRQQNGLSGFPKPQESVHDAFISGHSSNSISAGYGIMKALQLKQQDHYVVTVVGDGSFTGGMIYEAMNNAGRDASKLIVILNHNDMSISKNVGAIAKYLTGIRANPKYLKMKNGVGKVMANIPVVGRRWVRSLHRSKLLVKGLFYESTWFEEMGFCYLGPIDGHDLNQLISILRCAKRQKGPVLIHVDTIKGKGYSYAEQNPGIYHGIAKFNIGTGHPQSAGKDSYSNVFGEALCRLAQKDDRICAVTAAMKQGTGLQLFSTTYPERFFDVGIAEQHGVTFCAGLASQGMKPVFAVYSTFLQRGYDQIIHDCAIEGYHVVFCIDRAGIVGEDGETHQGVFDISFLSAVPHVTIYTPETYEELTHCLSRALYETEGVVAVRYPRGRQTMRHTLIASSGQDYIYQNNGGDILLITYGGIAAQMMTAIQSLPTLSALKLICVKPISKEVLSIVKSYRQVLFYEESMKNGGIAQQLTCKLHEEGYTGVIKIYAIDDMFVPAGNVLEILHRYHLDAEGIVQSVGQLHNRFHLNGRVDETDDS